MSLAYIAPPQPAADLQVAWMCCEVVTPESVFMQDHYRLIRVAKPDHWRDYHEIRRSVLWERRGQTNYDDQHADEYMPQHHPLLLLHADRAIGTTRLDDRGDGRGVVRLVALAEDFQRRGHGRRLSRFVKEYARNLGIKTLYVNADPQAVGRKRAGRRSSGMPQSLLASPRAASRCAKC